MRPIIFLKLLGLASFILPPAFCLLDSAAKQPNIVFILADDLGYRELGSYGQKKIRTPRIDELAAQGMRFTRAYSGNAVCAPSRCVLMTGKHPGHAWVRNNKSVKPEGQEPIGPGETTLAELLGAEGYVSGAFGKWGLGPTNSTGDPNDRGFKRFFGYNCQARAHTYYPDTLWSDKELFPLENDPPIPGHASLAEGSDPADPASYDIFKGQDYAPNHINAQALAFVRENAQSPFFLYYPTVIPHVALHVPDEELAPYLALGWNDPPFTRQGGYGYTPHFTPRAAYAAMITHMDTNVGKILDLLDELDLAEDTIVVFSSDNGTTLLGDEVDYEFFESVGALRELKGSLYEGGIRVPLIVRWPGKVKAGSVSDYLTGFEDWMPTLLDIIGAKTKVPEGADGVSLVPTLLGNKQKPRQLLYREFTGYGGQQALWMGKWKGIRQEMLRKGKKKDKRDPLEIELYDLEADTSESNNVASQHPEVVDKIRELMAREHTPSEIFPFPPIDG
ncbi:MAG: arylsulfatase [Verrucomicrobiales bacterium]